MATLLVDYMYAAGQSPASIKSFGYVGVMRYLAPLPNSKVMTKAEAFALHSAGLGIGLVWEWTNNRAGAGAAAGTVDAQRAEAQADALGYPSDCPIFYAIDYDAGGPTVAPYFQGVNQAARRPVGAYGPRPAVDWMIANRLAVYGWQAAGWVHGADSQVAHLKQLVGSKLIPNTDVNELLKPFPMWGLGEPDDMTPDQSIRFDQIYTILADGFWPDPRDRPPFAEHGALTKLLVRLEAAVNTVAARPPVDVAALAAALAGNQSFVDALATAVSAKAAVEYAGTLKPVQP